MFSLQRMIFALPLNENMLSAAFQSDSAVFFPYLFLYILLNVLAFL